MKKANWRYKVIDTENNFIFTHHKSLKNAKRFWKSLRYSKAKIVRLR